MERVLPSRRHHRGVFLYAHGYRGVAVATAQLALLLCCAIGGAYAGTPPGQPFAARMAAAFERNVGQAVFDDGTEATHVDAVLQSPASLAYIHPGGMYALQTQPNADATTNRYRTDIAFIGANPTPRIEWGAQADGFVRYMTRTTDNGVGRVSNRYHGITYHDVWPGIDVRYTGTAQGLKTDYIVHPGANPASIAWTFAGGTRLDHRTDGSLELHTPLKSLYEDAPVSWTTDALGNRTANVRSAFRVQGNTVGFAVGAYDSSRTLVIDPPREWATYFGTDKYYERFRVALDNMGNPVMSGTTDAVSMPTMAGVLQRRNKAAIDGVVVKFSDEGKLLWCTYMGGSGKDLLYDIACDRQGRIYVCGETHSPFASLPFRKLATAPFGDPDSLGTCEVIVVILEADGTEADHWLIYGKAEDLGRSICVRDNWLAVAGMSKGGPRLGNLNGKPYLHNATEDYLRNDIWVARFTYSSTTKKWQPDWLTFLGGDENDEASGVAIDSRGDVVVVGTTYSNNIQTTGGPYRGGGDAIAARFATTPSGPVHIWGSCFGGPESDQFTDVTITSNDDVVMCGMTSSATFPTYRSLHPYAAGGRDGMVMRYSRNNALVFSTFYGGNGNEYLSAAAANQSGDVWFGGQAKRTTNLPIAGDAFQKKMYSTKGWDDGDGILARITGDAGSLLYSSYYGAPPEDSLREYKGPCPSPCIPPACDPLDCYVPQFRDLGIDYIQSIATDGDAYIYVLSNVWSVNMDTTVGAYLGRDGLRLDSICILPFLTKFSTCPDSSVSIGFTGHPTTLCPGESRTLAAPAGFARYRWSNGDTTRTTTARSAGTYILTAITAGGCRYRDTLVFTVSAPIAIGMPAEWPACRDSLTTVAASAANGVAPYRYKWNRIEAGPEYLDRDTTATISVNPPTASRYEVTVTDALGCTARDTILISIRDPRPLAAPGALDFGNLGPCQSSSDDTVVVTNTMPYPIAIGGYMAGSGISIVTSLATPIELAPDASASLVVRASPSQPGTSNGTIAFTGTPCTWTLPVTYTISKAKLTASVHPNAISFGSGAACVTVSKDTTIVVRNGSTSAMMLHPGTVTGDASDFTILDFGTERNIPPGDSTAVHIRYIPAGTGTRTATVRLPFDAGSCADTLGVVLNAFRGTVTYTIAPEVIDMGTFSSCMASRDTTVTITNTGSAPATIELSAPPGVSYDPAGVYSMAPESSMDITVTVTPVAQGTFAVRVNGSSEPCPYTAGFEIRGNKEGIAVQVPARVDMGELTCGAATTTQDISIGVDGMGSVTLESIGAGRDVRLGLTEGTVLQSGVPVTTTLTWTPGTDGMLVDSVELTFQPCGIRKVIRVGGSRTTARLAARTPLRTLGTITGTLRDTVVFDNTGTDTLNLTFGVSSAHVNIRSTLPALTSAILPGTSVEVHYDLDCNSDTVLADTIMAEIVAPCPGSIVTALEARCSQQQQFQASANLAIDTMTVNTGDRFLLPLRIVSSANLNAAGARRFTARLAYHPGVLVGRNGTPDCFDGTYAYCTTEVSGERGTDTTGVLAQLEFTAILGTLAHTDVLLESFVWQGVETATITTSDGGVTIGNICTEGSERLLQPKDALAIRIAPNPATTAVNVDVDGAGGNAITADIYDAIGLRVATSPLPPGGGSGPSIRYSIPTAHLPAGAYTICVTVGTHTSRTNVLILR